MFWGACKRYARARCDYRWDSLKTVVPDSLESVNHLLNEEICQFTFFFQVDVLIIRKFARKCWRYMDGYRQKSGVDLSVKQVEYAVRFTSDIVVSLIRLSMSLNEHN